MNKLIYLLFLLGNFVFAQVLPKKDFGISLSYNNTNRHLQSYNSQNSISFPNVDYKYNLNFQNNFSFKTGISIFIVGNKFSYLYAQTGPYPSVLKNAHSIYGYLRLPFLFSYNVRQFYLDIGFAPCVRIFHLSDFEVRGSEIERVGVTYTIESHLGYYIPIKQQRLFLELALYVSEIGKNIYLPDNYVYNNKNKYSQNIQFSIGYMFGKTKIDSKSNESKN